MVTLHIFGYKVEGESVEKVSEVVETFNSSGGIYYAEGKLAFLVEIYNQNTLYYKATFTI